MEKKEKAVRDFVERIRGKFKDKIEGIILFGSYARREAKKFSDIDILIVFKELPEEWEKRIESVIDETSEIALVYGVKISPLLLSKEELLDNINSEALLFLDLTRSYRIIYDNCGFEEEMAKFKERIAREYTYNEEFEAWIEK